MYTTTFVEWQLPKLFFSFGKIWLPKGPSGRNYSKGMAVASGNPPGTQIQWDVIPKYQPQYYTPTNTFMGEPNDADGFWDTTVLPNGTYDITVFALDYWGNEFNMTRSVSVSN